MVAVVVKGVKMMQVLELIMMIVLVLKEEVYILKG